MVVHLGVRVDDGVTFDSLVQVARTAEAAKFDFVLRSADDADGLAVLAALAGLTERVGLVGAVDPRASQPFEVARQLATLDHLSDGRAGWSLATSAEEFVAVMRDFWDSWAPGAVLADRDTGTYADPGRISEVVHRGPEFDVRGFATLPAGPQGHPVLFHADGAGRRLVATGRDPLRHRVFAELSVDQLADDPGRVADLVTQSDDCDGFILAAAGLDGFVADVLPLLADRGSIRTEYAGPTLREHLDL